MLTVELTLPVPVPLIEDWDLVLATKAGDVAAFEKLVERYDRKLLRIAQHITHNLEDAQDIVQETFLKVFQNLHAFRGDSKFSTWLFRIAVNHSLMGLRKQRTKQRAGAELPLNADEEGNLPLDFSDWRPNPEELHNTSELRELLTAALQQLSPALRVVFVLHDIEGHSLRETAEAVGASLPAVKTRSLRARLQLRERLTAVFKREWSLKAIHESEPVVKVRQPLLALAGVATRFESDMRGKRIGTLALIR
jgi:RNA polymerase sigma-70 factor (ECF subfamily)